MNLCNDQYHPKKNEFKLKCQKNMQWKTNEIQKQINKTYKKHEYNK